MSTAMMQGTLVHIVPTVPPAFNGLADYSYKLWEHWPQPRPQWKCLAAQVPAGAQRLWPDAEIIPFQINKNALLNALKDAAPSHVVLHYVGYAYHSKGIPLWLVPALAEWKKQSCGHLCVMFHELYASGSPRQSAYWLQPWSKKIVAQLVSLADRWLCSSELAAEVLVNQFAATRSQGNVVPVGANIEPSSPIDFSRPWPLAHGGKLWIAAFGLPETRVSAIESHAKLLKLLYQRDLIEKIALVGKSGDPAHEETMNALQHQVTPTNRENLWETHYDLMPMQISDLLSQYDLSLSRDWPQLLTKSGSYAAATVHGLISVCSPSSQTDTHSFNLDPQHVFHPPFVPNRDCDAANALEILSDNEAIQVLKHRVREAALNDLSWSQIVRVWQEALA